MVRFTPFAFARPPVIVFTSLVYLALIVVLLVVHLRVPPAPKHASPIRGVNITEAWRDLQEISSAFHPYNSHRNDEVRDWLLRRIHDILKSNGVSYKTEDHVGAGGARSWNVTKPLPVTVFNDNKASNVSFSSGLQSVYFEGTNIMVYIRGSDDEQSDWWTPSVSHKLMRDKSASTGVLVNAHYDSVSTGYGATDDGVGVVSVLQLIRYFTTTGHQPKRGIVALLNNGEEDFLNGARAFTQHPLSNFTRTFLNLEGAGAGGRATLFRSTDTEVTKFYKRSPYPFANVVSGDGFKRGLIRSQTDYVVFNGDLGMRGLDVAFMEPRAKYHTSQDAAKETSIRSLWHMLSAAVETVKGLSSDAAPEDQKTSQAVWFDIFGQEFAVLALRTLFAITLTLLIVSPVFLIAFTFLLNRMDKWYPFSRKTYLHSSGAGTSVPLMGWRGFFGFPVAFVLATAVVVALAFVTTKLNPYIIYSSEYAVWSMMLCAWFFTAWFSLRSADSLRPSALQRFYALMWMYVGGWIVLVASTVAQDRFDLAGTYFIVVGFAGVFFAFLISYLEMLVLPRKSEYARRSMEVEPPRRSRHASERENPASSYESFPGGRGEEHEGGNEEPTETTSLLSDRPGRPQTFARYHGNRRIPGDGQDDEDEDVGTSKERLNPAYGDEQPWSRSLPTVTWILQFLLIAPITLILVGQISLLLTSALHQTPADGSPVLFIYLCIAVLSMMLMVPLSPFLHRFTYHVPTFLFLVLIGTAAYNVVAFPFSPNNRLKVFFQQQVDLSTGINKVSLTGLDRYVQSIVHAIPSAAGQIVECRGYSEDPRRAGLVRCEWNGLAPHVVPPSSTPLPPEQRYGDWLHFNASLTSEAKHGNVHEGRIQLVGRNTRACKIVFDQKVDDLWVEGAGQDSRFPRVSKDGAKEVRLWRREWEEPWDVQVKWSSTRETGPGLDGEVVCLWSDQNEAGTIPALDEVRGFMPTWSTVSKLSDGLVEGRKTFRI